MMVYFTWNSYETYVFKPPLNVKNLNPSGPPIVFFFLEIVEPPGKPR